MQVSYLPSYVLFEFTMQTLLSVINEKL